MSTRIPITQKTFHGHINPKDTAGNEVPIQDASEVYSSSNEAVFTVAADPDDPKKFVGTIVGAGKADLNISLDSDPGGDTVIISQVLEIEITPDLATSVNGVIDDAPVEDNPLAPAPTV